MSSMFDTDVRLRRNHTPWARMGLAHFMKEMAFNIFQGDKRDAIENRVILECHYRHQVASSFWWTITWTGEDKERHSAEAQELDLCLWRAAEIEMRIRRKLEQKRVEVGDQKLEIDIPSIESQYDELRQAVWQFINKSSRFEPDNIYQAKLKDLLGDYKGA